MEDHLKELLKAVWVDTEGVVRWKIPPARRNKVNDRVGSVSKTLDGKEYLRTSFKSIKKIAVHRIAYMYYHPGTTLNSNDFIDHIDQNTLNNSKDNLRLTDAAGNAKNCKLHAKSTTGICGVSWSKTMNKYRAYVSSTHEKISKQKILGYYDNIELAAKAAQDARNLLEYSHNHGCEITQ